MYATTLSNKRPLSCKGYVISSTETIMVIIHVKPVGNAIPQYNPRTEKNLYYQVSFVATLYTKAQVRGKLIIRKRRCMGFPRRGKIDNDSQGGWS